jgi:hypothetical protein
MGIQEPYKHKKAHLRINRTDKDISPYRIGNKEEVTGSGKMIPGGLV